MTALVLLLLTLIARLPLLAMVLQIMVAMALLILLTHLMSGLEMKALAQETAIIITLGTTGKAQILISRLFQALCYR